jgi:hypothetical protein
MAYALYLCRDCQDPIFRKGGNWHHRKKDGSKSHAPRRGDRVTIDGELVDHRPVTWSQPELFGEAA